jgi:hypothetical protein
MFPRILLDDGEWLVEAAWLGVGRIYVSRKSTGERVALSRQAKLMLMDTLDAMQARGAKIEPENPYTCAVLHFFARLALCPAEVDPVIVWSSRTADDLAVNLMIDVQHAGEL